MDPQALVQWLPPDGMTGEVLAFEPYEGGRYKLVLRYDQSDHPAPGKTTEGSDVVEADFVELRPGERIVQLVEFQSDDPAFAGEMTMTWSFDPVEGGTEVTVSAHNVPPGIRQEDHETAMNLTLANLARFVE